MATSSSSSSLLLCTSPISFEEEDCELHQPHLSPEEDYNNTDPMQQQQQQVKKEDLEHAVGALLSMPSSPHPHPHHLPLLSPPPSSSVPSTPQIAFGALSSQSTTAAGAGASIPATGTTSWNDVDDVDIFTLFLGEMDLDESFSLGPSHAQQQQHHHPAQFAPQPSPPFTPSQQFDLDYGNSAATATSGAAPNYNNNATGYTWADALNTNDLSSGFIFNSTLPDDFIPFSSASSPAFSSSIMPPPPLPSSVLQAATLPPQQPQHQQQQRKPRQGVASATKAKPASTAPKPIATAAAARTGSAGGGRANSLSDEEDEDYDNTATAGAGGNKSSKSTQQPPLSPKSHAIREKNREAVRKCRQKKREREDAVAERIQLLEQENEELKIQLKLGSPDRAREMEQETKRLAQRIQDLLDTLVDTPAAMAELREACHMYINHSTERSGDRSAATSGTLSRISRLIDPTLFAKFYLWHGTARDDYFSNPHGLWASISREMNVTDSQTLQLAMRRDKLESLRAEIMDVSCKLADLQSHVALRERADRLDANFVNQIQAQLSPVQLAKFILWLRKDKTVQQVVKPTDVLSSFFTQVLKTTDPAPPTPVSSLQQQQSSPLASLPGAAATTASAAMGGGVYRPQQLPPQPQQPQQQQTPAMAFKKPSLEMARERVMLLTKALWDGPKETLEHMARSGFDPNVVLIDPNNGGEYHGIHKMLQYVHRIRLAFGEKIAVDLREMSLEKEKARATWVLHGTYRGKLNSAGGTGAKKHLKHVSFVIVCTYTFRPNSSLVQEMLVSWDAIGLMRQIGLLRGAPKQQQQQAQNGAPDSSAVAAATALHQIKRVRTTELAELEQITALERSHIERLAKLFSASNEEELSRIGAEILHAECVFQDSYMGFEFRGLSNCLTYVRKVRSPFPTLTVASATLREEVEGGGAALGSPLRLNWQIRAVYAGPLVKSPADCSFNAVLFVTFDEHDHTIDSVHFSWNAQRLMDQLGKTARPSPPLPAAAFNASAANPQQQKQ